MGEPKEAQQKETPSGAAYTAAKWMGYVGLVIFFLALFLKDPGDEEGPLYVVGTIAWCAVLLSIAIWLYREVGVTGFVALFIIFFVFDETKARINCGPSLNKNGFIGLMFKASYPIEGDCRAIDLYPPLTIRFTEPILIKLGLVPPINIFDPANMMGKDWQQRQPKPDFTPYTPEFLGAQGRF